MTYEEVEKRSPMLMQASVNDFGYLDTVRLGLNQETTVIWLGKDIFLPYNDEIKLILLDFYNKKSKEQYEKSCKAANELSNKN